MPSPPIWSLIFCLYSHRLSFLGPGRPNGIELSFDPDVFPSKSPAKGESANADGDTEIHDLVNAVAVGLQHGGELVPRDEVADGADAGVDDDVWSDIDLRDALLELAP